MLFGEFMNIYSLHILSFLIGRQFNLTDNHLREIILYISQNLMTSVTVTVSINNVLQ